VRTKNGERIANHKKGCRFFSFSETLRARMMGLNMQIRGFSCAAHVCFSMVQVNTLVKRLCFSLHPTLQLGVKSICRVRPRQGNSLVDPIIVIKMDHVPEKQPNRSLAYSWSFSSRRQLYTLTSNWQKRIIKYVNMPCDWKNKSALLKSFLAVKK